MAYLLNDRNLSFRPTRRQMLVGAGVAALGPWLGGCASAEDEQLASAYLAGNYGPVTEEVTETELEVVGELPPELSGRYLRNGPNPAPDTNPTSHHWFIGDGMVHAVRLDGGRALWYRNRWIRTDAIAERLGEQHSGQLPEFGPNTHVIGFADSTWAIVEGGATPVELSDELETLGSNDFEGTLLNGFTAHPKLDPVTGELHAMCYAWPGLGDVVQYVVVGPDGEVRKTVEIPVPGMVMMHDMSITENYAVIYDLPVTINIASTMTSRFPFRWNPEYGARVGLLPRAGKAEDVIWTEVSPGYVYHPMNAYETADGKVVLDVARYASMFDRDVYGPFGDSNPTLDRWVIDPKTRRVSESRLDERNQEFPRCNPRFNGRPYRYGYAAQLVGRDFPAILKHDHQAGSVTEIPLGAGRNTGEPYFVPKEGATAEDAGWLMTFVYDANTNRSELAVFDAEDPARGQVAAVKLPVRVPYGFHGSWVPDDGVGI